MSADVILEGVRVLPQRLADLDDTSGRDSFAHEDSRRRGQAIFCHIEGRDLASFVGRERDMWYKNGSVGPCRTPFWKARMRCLNVGKTA